MDTASAGSSSSDQGQREAFLNELSQFLSDRGRYVCRSPNLAGRSIDLHDLYNKVTTAGGYQKVTERGFWEDFLELYGYPAISTTLAYGLQRIYQLYLEEYERVHYFGDDEPQPYQRSFPGGYSRYRYKISAHQRMQANMNVTKPKISNYDRVVYSLESCLPNEVDFAVNACTLLSGESRHVLKLPQCKRIVDALLLHAGIVSDGYDSYRDVLQELQTRTKHDYRKFWKYSIRKKSILPILLPDIDSDINLRRKEQGCSSMDDQHPSISEFADNLQKRLEGEEMKSDDPHEKSNRWSELFHGDRSLGVEDYEGQRVLQIALVLLNLSFEDFNVSLLARHPSLVCFVFLCIHSEYSCLRQTGLDILSNISSHMQLLHFDYDVITMMFETINSAILSNDKFERVRGLEILGNICRPRPNLDYICAHVSDDVYDAAVQNLMVTDVETLIAAIESLYRLSKLGEHACTRILFVKGCINIFVGLVSLNVRAFGPEKLSEIRLARKIVPGHAAVPHATPQPSYQLPPAMSPHPQHVSAARPVVMPQPQIKIGSAQQSQPTVVSVVPSHTPMPAQAAMPTTNVAITTHPQSTVKAAPVPQHTSKPTVTRQQPEPTQAVAKTTLPSPPRTDSNSGPVVVVAGTPPPPASTPPSVPSTKTHSSPPGVGPTYTHSETGTVPPVFHYMPAPPTDIPQDNSSESFTKLWIWATYESEEDSYIPRVDVYCEYLASSNRYGRQGKAEILSATDFGKCLKKIFPMASSRLFNQGRGQPQYHIAGIRKRATPLPVPGYQLKNTSSVFSSEQEYERIPVKTKSTAGENVSPMPATAVQTFPSQVSTVSVPIQQLQFQPILIVSTLPGSNNVAAPTGASATQVERSQAVTSVAVGDSTTTPTADRTLDNTESWTGSVPSDSGASSNLTSTAAQALDKQAVSTGSNSVPSQTHSNTAIETRSPNTVNVSDEPENHTADSNSVTQLVENGDSGREKSDLPAVTESGEKNQADTDSAVSADSAIIFNGLQSNSSISDATDNHTGISNGFMENQKGRDISKDSETAESLKQRKYEPMIVDCSPESKDSLPIANGFLDGTDEGTKSHNANGGKESDGVNGKTKADKVSSTGYDKPSEISADVVPVSENNCESNVTSSINEQKLGSAAENNDAGNDNSTVPPDDVKANISSACAPEPGTNGPATPQGGAPCENNIVATPTNPIPHSALNQRLKETITRRKSANTNPATSSDALPPSVLNQYSYKQDGLAQQIINVAPHQVHHQQFPVYRPTIPITATQPAVQVTRKRAAPHPTESVPPAKVPRPVIPPSHSTLPPNVPLMHPPKPRYPMSILPMTPQPQHQHAPPKAGTPIPAHSQAGQHAKAKPPTIDLMAPNASLLVLYRNVGKIPFTDYTDEKEDAITKSVRLTASLILKNIAKYSNLGRSMVRQHEDFLACVAMSQMDCSPVVAKLLSELNV